MQSQRWNLFRNCGPAGSSSRSGKALALFALVLPGLVAMASLVLDGGLLMVEHRSAQHAVDAAATAAAADLAWGTGNPTQTATSYLHDWNGFPASAVDVRIPPSSGVYAGRNGYVEVTVEQPATTKFLWSVNSTNSFTVKCRAVGGNEPTTAPAAVVVLDPDPPQVTLGSLPISLPSVTPLIGGLETIGVGRLLTSRAIHVNNSWGGLDENNKQVGKQSLLKHACSCTPLVSLTHVRAADIRVVGGVDDPDNYGPYQNGGSKPLQANRRPVPDPYATLPAPTFSADPANVSGTNRGGVSVANLPILPPVVLQPGVYDWIQVVTGPVTFSPGVYIIRKVNPVTQIALSILAGPVQADGVLFYITNSSGYSPGSGVPDAADGETVPAAPSVLTLVPSAIIDAGLLNSRFSGLNAPTSPFNGMLIYQRRQDRRPILIVQQGLIGASQFSGNVYAKWAHVLVTANGTLHTAFACGSLRVASVLDLTIDPNQPLPQALDVFLVE